MRTDNTSATVEVAGVLARIHVLLWQASAEAAALATVGRDLHVVDLANDLTYASDEVFHLVPVDYQALLLELPPVTERDPIRLASDAGQLAHTIPQSAWPPGLDAVVGLLNDTLKGLS